MLRLLRAVRATVLLGAAAAGDDGSYLLELTETNFDVLLREVPVALVAYFNPTTELHYPNLLPTLRKLADVRDDVEMFELADEVAGALQLADQAWARRLPQTRYPRDRQPAVVCRPG